jgi:TolA-binding protein
MSLVQLHPEELLDRAALGTLTASEQATLERHLAVCAVCRFERDVRADFAAELDAPLPMHGGDLLAGVLDRVVPPALPDVPPPLLETPVAPRGRRRRFPIWFLVAASLTVASAAIASGRTTVLAFFAPAAPPTSVVAPPEPPANTSIRSHFVPAAAPIREAASPAPVAPAEPIAPADAPLESAPKPHAPRSDAAGLVREPAAYAGGPPTTAPAVPPSIDRPAAPPIDPPGASASAVFADANAARRRGDHRAAADLYKELVGNHATSAEATAARAMLGRMYLDDGDAGQALSAFDGYLATGAGSLREEAMVGRARALERLGRSAEEHAAWGALLERFPQTIHAERARGRLAATAH